MNTEGHHLFLSVNGKGSDQERGRKWGERGHSRVLRASELSLKVYFVKGSPTASPSLVDSINVLTLLTNPGMLNLIHTLKEAQKQCRGGRGKREQDM